MSSTQLAGLGPTAAIATAVLTRSRSTVRPLIPHGRHQYQQHQQQLGLRQWQQRRQCHGLAAAVVVLPANVPLVACRASFFQDQDVSAAEWPVQLEQQQQQELAASAVDPNLESADLVFQHPAGVAVCVFGVEHLERQPHIGEWILENRPAAVVVETACTPQHGSAPGTAITCRDQVAGAAGMFLRVFCQIAAALQEQGDAARAPGGVWQQATSNFNGEQLAYIAAMATGAQLLFGDRPKDITYRRLFSQPSLQELDAAFAAEVTASFSSQLLQMLQVQQPDASEVQQAAWVKEWQQHQQHLSQTAVWTVMMREREAVMLGVVDQVCSKGLLLMPGMPKPSLALVVGSAHLPGLQELWESGAWRKLVGEGGLSAADSPVLQAPVLDHGSMAAAGAGVKRGLLEAVMRLSMPEEVMDDLQESLPPIEGQEGEAREWAFEIYSTCRMQLAALPDSLLDDVCGAMPGVDMRDLLAPLRELRPVNGGSGWDPVLGMQLRALNFDVTPAAEE